jgi:hypothetical protein
LQEVGLQANWTLNIAGRYLPILEHRQSTNKSQPYLAHDGVIQPILVDKMDATWIWRPYVLAIARRYAAHNAGHAILETAVPLMHLMMFAQQQPGFHGPPHKPADWLLYMNDSCVDRTDHWVAMGPEHVCTRFSRDLIYTIASNVIERALSSVHTLCFSGATFGFHNFNPFYRGGGLARNHTARKTYRDLLYRKKGLPIPTPIRPGTGPITITLIKKVGKRTITNYDEVEAFMARESSSFRSCGETIRISVIDLATISLAQQLRMLSQTTVLITVPGSASWYSLFLPDNATMIYVPFCDRASSPPCSDWEVNAYHKQTPLLKTLTYGPVDPSIDLVPMSWYFDVRINVTNLEALLKIALRPWIERSC